MKKHVVLFVLLLLAGMITLSPAQTWTIEQVTDNTEPDSYPFVASVSSGLMIVYTHGDPDNEAFVANNFSGSWTSSRITDNSTSDIATDIAARYNEQTAHIALWWQDTPDQEMSYVVGSPGSWDIQRVTDDADNDAWGSLAIDNAGHVHMTYYKSTGGDAEIFYANNATGHWVSEQVTDNATDDALPWLALDSDGNPNIVYTDATNLWFTKKTAGIWTTPELVAPGVIFLVSLPFLALDADDNCHVTYSKDDGTDLEIYYANNVTGPWQESKVTTNDYDDLYSTLIIDPENKVHIVYVAKEPADDEIFYANNTAGVWSINRVTDNSVNDVAVFGRYFASDAQGTGHIFFWNNSDGDNEIYHAISDTPIHVGVNETNPQTSPVSMNLSSVFSNQVNYSTPTTGKVTLKVYDASGSLVKTLVDDVKPQGEYSVIWNGTSNEGVKAAPGVYFYHLIAGDQKASVKAILR